MPIGGALLKDLTPELAHSLSGGAFGGICLALLSPEEEMFKHLSSLILLSLLTSVAAPGRALASDGPEFGSAWQRITDELQAEGVGQIGDFRIDKFMAEAAAVKWRENSSLPPEDITGNRRSAYFLKKTTEVYISESSQNLNTDLGAQLELHEAMGALGYNDGTYALSTALTILSKTKDPVARATLANEYGEDLFRKGIFKVAGGSSVSGGGDLNALVIKNAVLNSFLTEPENLGPDLIEIFPSISFEPIYVKDASQVVTRYKLRGPKGILEEGNIPGTHTDHGVQDVLIVFVPIPVWQRSEQSRRQVIEEIKSRLMDLYPPLPRKLFESKIPSGCGFKNFTFLTDSFGLTLNMTTLRTTKEWFKRGCAKSSDLVGTHYWGDGDLPWGGDPDDASHNFYICHWQVGESKGEVKFANSRYAKLIHATNMTNLPGDVIFGVGIGAASNGMIRSLDLSGGKDKLEKTVNTFGHAEMSGTFNNLPSSMSCDQLDPRGTLALEVPK